MEDQQNLALTVQPAEIPKIDNGKPALYNPAAFDQIWKASRLFAASDLVPAAYKGKPENCFIAIEMADRMGISPFAMLQSLVIIQGKPSMEAKLIIALVNDSGIFEDPLEYETIGDDAYAQDYQVRCFATMKKTGKVCLGPWITYPMVKGEGWLDKGGSKWKTMPSIMFMYRAASFFAKVYCPNITMGMQTREEMEDIRPIQEVNPQQPVQRLATRQAVVDIHQEKPLFEGVSDSQHQGQQLQQGPDDGAQQQGLANNAAAPTRERGKPSPGKQRRTAAEVEEDRVADLRDQEAAQAAQQQQAPPAKFTCGSAVTRIEEDGDEYCDACGINLTQEQAAPEQQTQQPAAQVQQQEAAPAPKAAHMADLF